MGAALRDGLEGIWSARRGTYRILYHIDDERREVSFCGLGIAALPTDRDNSSERRHADRRLQETGDLALDQGGLGTSDRFGPRWSKVLHQAKAPHHGN